MVIAPAGLTPLAPAPSVTVVMAVRDEASYIGQAVRSVVGQTYSGRIDIVVADGGSIDDTVAEAVAAAGDRPLTVHDNPDGSYAAGLNVAIAAARGGVMVKLDGHAELDPTYIEAVTRALRETGSDVAGGRIRTRGRGSTGMAIAFALSRRAVVGGADFRYPGPTRFTQSVPFGAYRRDVFAAVGVFRTDIGRAEDLELHARVRAAGGRLILLGETLATYWCRDTFTGLARQYFASGADLARHPRGIRPYQIAPAAALALFVVLVASTAAGRLPATVVAGPVLAYAALPASIAVAAARARVSAARAGWAAVVVHASQAAGFWWGSLTLRRGPATSPRGIP